MNYRCFGAVVGDVIGSRFEFNNCKSKGFPLFSHDSFPTDDSFMTVALMEALSSYVTQRNLDWFREQVIDSYKFYYRKYPAGGYGGRFKQWCESDSREPYGSYGNGAAMRVSPCAYISNDLDECLRVAEVATAVTHNHPSALFWVKHLITIIFRCRTEKWTQSNLESYVKENIPEFYLKIDNLRDWFFFNETCDGTVPVAIACVIESRDFEDAIRNAISLGGDSDTIADITGAIAEPMFGIPTSMGRAVISRLPGPVTMTIKRFSEMVDSLI